MRAALGVGPDAAAVAWVLRDREEVQGCSSGLTTRRRPDHRT